MNEVVREQVRFDAPAGRLEGELCFPALGSAAFAALVAGPHPFMGGTMENTIVAAVAQALARCGGVSLRFDYGGVRAAQLAASMAAFWETGHAPEDPDRLMDTEAAARFVCDQGVEPLVLVGYSFGAFAVWQTWRAMSMSPRTIVLLSPTVGRHAFDDCGRAASAGTAIIVIHSEDDFATPAERVARWAAGLALTVRRVCLPAGNHFFRGQEHAIAALVCEAVEESMAPTGVAEVRR